MTDDDEDELLRRFNALRAPPDDPADVRGDPRDDLQRAAEEAREEDDELERIADGRWFPPRQALRHGDDDLQRRVLGLKGEERGDDEAETELSDTEVEAFMASLAGGTATATQDVQSDEGLPPPPENYEALDREASRLLESTAGFVKPDSPPTDGHGDEPAADGEETEEQILARALEEASLDRLPSPSSPPLPASSPSHSPPPNTSAEEQTPAWSFPSLPTHHPDSSSEDPDVEARMNLLFSLSGPTSAPSAKGKLGPPPSTRSAGQGWNIPGYEDGRDNDLESWCCICNSDATVRCLGCEGDLYCGKCWAEGHGPGGEQGHRVQKFVWDRGKRVA